MNILVFAPHNDDEILGVGGTIKNILKKAMTFVFVKLLAGSERLYFKRRRRTHTIY